jgi:hypothetical protein
MAGLLGALRRKIGGPVLGRLEDGRVKLTEFVKNAKHGQGMTVNKQQGSETGLSSTEQKVRSLR